MMKQQPFNYLLTALLIITFSCEENAPFGIETDNPFDLHLIDTLSLELSTVYIDSLATQGAGELLIGQLEDSYLGKVSTGNYFEVSLGETFLLLDETDIYDSLGFIIYPYVNTYGTGIDQRVNLYQVTEDFEPVEDFFYQFDELQRTRNPIGSFVLEGQEDDEEDSVFVKIQSRLGRLIYQNSVDRTEAISIEEDFRDLLQGFSLEVEPTNANRVSVVPFNPKFIKLRFYYSRPGDDGLENLYHDFSTYNGFEFNAITAPVQGSLLHRLQVAEQLGSKETGGVSFIQGGSALVTQIRIPNVLKMAEAFDQMIIHSAVLEIKPTRDSYSPARPLPDTLALHYLDRFDNIKKAMGFRSEFNTALGGLIEDTEFDKETRYEIDIRNYLQDLIDNRGIEGETFFISIVPDQVRANLQTLAIDASGFETKLKIFISNYKD
ncbi:MAG: hypothetical protein Roseis2KO_20850 [Roseivirga sp.]